VVRKGGDAEVLSIARVRGGMVALVRCIRMRAVEGVMAGCLPIRTKRYFCFFFLLCYSYLLVFCIHLHLYLLRLHMRITHTCPRVFFSFVCDVRSDM